MIVIKKTSLFLITGMLLSLSLLSGCIAPLEPIDDPVTPERGFFMGMNLANPLSGQEMQDPYIQTAEYAEFATIWSVGVGAEGFWEYSDKLKSSVGKTILNDFIRGNDLFPFIQFSFIDKKDGNLILKTPETLPNATLSDQTWRTLYKQSILEMVQTAKPLYISVGNEINRWYELYGMDEENPNGFQHFISLYEEIYSEVKALSPKTQVCCVFSREIVSELREADLSVLSLFKSETLDLLLFTTYPIAVKGINTPSDIPLDYYQKAAVYHPNVPFGFSEIGWPTYGEAGGEQGQYDFLKNLSTTLTIDQGISLYFFGYCWLHDLEGGDTNGLIGRDGSEKQGYQAWKEISQYNLWMEQPNEQIVFVSKADSEENELYLLDKSQTIIRLTNNTRMENNPALSFDGSKIAYHAGDPNDPLTWEIYVMDLETLEETQITDNIVLDGHPDWSPDGTKIIYASFQDAKGNPAAVADLYVVDINDTTITQLTDNSWEDNDPEWSPDGTKIVFKSNRHTQIDAREEIYVMDSNGENIQRLTTTCGWESDHDPSWSPDSQIITYMHYGGSRPWMDLVDLQTFIHHWDELTPWNTYVVDLQGEAKQVTNTEYIAQLAVFSKNGENILFLDNEFILLNNKLRGISHRFTIIKPNGTLKRQLLPDDRHSPTLEYFDW